MDGVAGMMRSLKLSEEEKKGVKIRLSAKEKGKSNVAQAVGKVLSEKLAHQDAISLSLGKVWCPIKGTDCREVGDNLFVFTFKQESGKRKALEDGPWMFDKDLVVVEEYDPGKRLEDYEFNDIPIWVRIFNLPLGMMNEESAEEIGNTIGRFVEVDAGRDGKAIGKFMRVKIRMKIDKPIMRGFTLDDDEESLKQRRKKMSIDGKEEDEEEGLWCRFEYEFLPDFCYACGIIGHGEKDCSTQLKKGESPQFGRWLKADVGRRRNYGEEDWSRRGNARSGGGNRSLGFSRSYERSGSGSDGPSWRKDGSRSSGGRDSLTEKGEEVTSPAKTGRDAPNKGTPKRLDMDVEALKRSKNTGEGEGDGGRMLAAIGQSGQTVKAPTTEPLMVKASGEQAREETSQHPSNPKAISEDGGKQQSLGGRKYKKVPRKDKEGQKGCSEREQVLGRKRGHVEGDVEEAEVKKGRVEAMEPKEGEVAEEHGNTTTTSTLAGLSEQPRRQQ